MFGLSRKEKFLKAIRANDIRAMENLRFPAPHHEPPWKITEHNLEFALEAIIHGDQKTLKYLHSHGINFKFKNFGGMNALMMAVADGNMQAFDYFMDSGWFKINAKDKMNRTALYHACANNAPSEIVEKLCAAGAQLNIRCKHTKTTALMVVCQAKKSANRNKCIEILCKAGAQVNLKDAKGKSAIYHLFDYNRDFATARLLIRYGANLEDAATHFVHLNNLVIDDPSLYTDLKEATKFFNFAKKRYAEQNGTINEQAPKNKTTYEALSDDELLITKTAANGMTLTSLFNFQSQDRVRTRYMPGYEPQEDKTDFFKISDKHLKKMFNTLKGLGAKPSSAYFKPAAPRKRVERLDLNFPDSL